MDLLLFGVRMNPPIPYSTVRTATNPVERPDRDEMDDSERANEHISAENGSPKGIRERSMATEAIRKEGSPPTSVMTPTPKIMGLNPAQSQGLSFRMTGDLIIA
ncbi:hypothetical protein AAG906_008702 [Vitis piasezkii]